MKKLLSFFTKRSTKYGSNFIFYTIIVLAILVFINYLSQKHYKRWDVTKNKKHSISEQTIKVIKDLQAEITLKAFYRKGNEREKRFKLPLIEVNEALSSQQAEEILKQDIKINKQNKHEIDRMAAAIIVQRWLDQQM